MSVAHGVENGSSSPWAGFSGGAAQEDMKGGNVGSKCASVSPSNSVFYQTGLSSARSVEEYHSMRSYSVLPMYILDAFFGHDSAGHV